MSRYVTIQGYRVDSRSGKPDKDKEFDYLLPKKGSQEALEDLKNAVDEDNAKDEPTRNCYNKTDQFTNYDDPKSLYEVPTNSQAVRMCSGCPLFDLCKEYADTAKPVWGVWAGKVYGRNLLENDG